MADDQNLRNDDGTFTEAGAKKFGQEGGESAQESGKAHQLTDEERARGGENSRGGDDE